MGRLGRRELRLLERRRELRLLERRRELGLLERRGELGWLGELGLSIFIVHFRALQGGLVLGAKEGCLGAHVIPLPSLSACKEEDEGGNRYDGHRTANGDSCYRTSAWC